jgi:pyruvate dehydrogenase E2 component (dihydrolipoamide acetyltransferase)
MAVDFVIPKLGDNVAEATIVNWLVEDGAQVNEGDEILEVETDKAVIPVPSNASGTIKFGNFGPGDVIKIDAVVATIETGNGGGSGPAGDSAPAEEAPAEADTTASAPVATPDVEAEPVATEAEAESTRRATPVARKIAADIGVNLETLAGSGVLGKVTKADVLAAADGDSSPKEPPPPAPAPAKAEKPAPVAKPAPQPTAAPAPSFPPTPEEDVLERRPLKGIRGVIARRMAESVHTTARVTLMTEVDATELVTLREQLKARYSEAWGFSPGYNDLLAMIVANALSQFPYMNARFAADGQSIEHLKPINMGMAVDTDRGLLVTVLRNADRMGLQELGTEFRELVKKARTGKAAPDELSGSTFTITSLGIYRVDAFTPVINLPEAAILGVGRIHEKPVVKDGEIVARKMMTLSLVFDHRLTDGAPAARFLDYICELVEEPYLLFLTRR